MRKFCKKKKKGSKRKKKKEKKKKKVKTYENDQYVLDIMKILSDEAKNSCHFPLGTFQPPF